MSVICSYIYILLVYTCRGELQVLPACQLKQNRNNIKLLFVKLAGIQAVEKIQ